MKLTEPQRWMIIQALHIAAECYADDSRENTDAGDPRTAAQFLRQRDEALALADAIEEADEVTP